jgi:hypothetical protein
MITVKSILLIKEGLGLSIKNFVYQNSIKIIDIKEDLAQKCIKSKINITKGIFKMIIKE